MHKLVSAEHLAKAVARSPRIDLIFHGAGCIAGGCDPIQPPCALTALLGRGPFPCLFFPTSAYLHRHMLSVVDDIESQ
jgi:hypothetical protein